MITRPPMETIGACRSCGSTMLTDVLAFGDTPIADRLVRPDDPDPEFTASLTLAHCEDCALCQIRETVEPRVLFGPDYPYFSSVSPALLDHFRNSAMSLIEQRKLKRENLVVEAASNDGYMLDVFRDHRIGVLGIDPADGPVSIARSRGIETIHDFFSNGLALRLAAQGCRADIFLANNVLAHVADTNDFVSGIANILAEGGIAVIECPYLLDLVDNGEFDTIYHQHLLYVSLTALKPLFSRHGLHLNDAERLCIHGGSIRLYVSRQAGQSPRLRMLLEKENRRNIRSSEFYAGFTRRIEIMRSDTREAITVLKAEGKRLAGYGAAAKSTTLMHYFGIGREDLDFIIDKSSWKQGLEMPVTRIPIVSPSRLSNDSIDTVLIFAWNFANEIVSENTAFTDGGGKFLVLVPELKVLDRGAVSLSL